MHPLLCLMSLANQLIMLQEVNTKRICLYHVTSLPTVHLVDCHIAPSSTCIILHAYTSEKLNALSSFIKIASSPIDLKLAYVRMNWNVPYLAFATIGEITFFRLRQGNMLLMYCLPSLTTYHNLMRMETLFAIVCWVSTLRWGCTEFRYHEIM